MVEKNWMKKVKRQKKLSVLNLHGRSYTPVGHILSINRTAVYTYENIVSNKRLKYFRRIAKSFSFWLRLTLSGNKDNIATEKSMVDIFLLSRVSLFQRHSLTDNPKAVFCNGNQTFY